MVLPLIPCADAVAASKTHQTELISSDHGHALQHGLDSCNPFCSCSCCSVHTQIKSFVTLPFSPSYSSFLDTAYLMGKYVNISVGVWQPPRMLS